MPEAQPRTGRCRSNATGTACCSSAVAPGGSATSPSRARSFPRTPRPKALKDAYDYLVVNNLVRDGHHVMVTPMKFSGGMDLKPMEGLNEHIRDVKRIRDQASGNGVSRRGPWPGRSDDGRPPPHRSRVQRLPQSPHRPPGLHPDQREDGAADRGAGWIRQGQVAQREDSSARARKLRRESAGRRSPSRRSRFCLSRSWRRRRRRLPRPRRGDWPSPGCRMKRRCRSCRHLIHHAPPSWRTRTFWSRSAATTAP